MKIIYVPVTIPWNSRSLVAVVMTVVCSILVGLTMFSNDWYSRNYSRSVYTVWADKGVDVSSTTTTDDTSSTDTLNQVLVKAGPWRMDATLCGYNNILGQSVCHDRSLVFHECANGDAETRPSLLVQTISFEGSLDFNWCQNWRYFTAGFVLMILAVLFGGVTLIVSFYREMCHGPWTLVSNCFLLAALVVWGIGVEEMKGGELVTLEAALTRGDHVVTSEETLGFSLVVTILVQIVWLVAAILTLSLFCCVPKHDGPPPPKPPTIQIVSVDPSAAGGPMVQIPEYPPGYEPNVRDEGASPRGGGGGGSGGGSKTYRNRTSGALEIDYGGADGFQEEFHMGGGQMEEMRTPQRSRSAPTAAVAGGRASNYQHEKEEDDYEEYNAAHPALSGQERYAPTPEGRHPNGEYRPSPAPRTGQQRRR